MKKFILSLAALAFAGIAANAQVSIDFTGESSITAGGTKTYGTENVFTITVKALGEDNNGNQKAITIEKNETKFYISNDNGSFEKYTMRLKTGGSVGAEKQPIITGEAYEAGELKLYLRSSNSTDEREVTITDGDDNEQTFKVSDALDKKTEKYINSEGNEGTNTIYACHSINISEGAIKFVVSGGINFHKIVFIPNSVKTPVEDIEAENASKVVKTIENGQIIIIKNGVKYNVLGQIVK